MNSSFTKTWMDCFWKARFVWCAHLDIAAFKKFKMALGFSNPLSDGPMVVSIQRIATFSVFHRRCDSVRAYWELGKHIITDVLEMGSWGVLATNTLILFVPSFCSDYPSLYHLFFAALKTSSAPALVCLFCTLYHQRRLFAAWNSWSDLVARGFGRIFFLKHSSYNSSSIGHSTTSSIDFIPINTSSHLIASHTLLQVIDQVLSSHNMPSFTLFPRLLHDNAE